jgi:hypothetical protein
LSHCRACSTASRRDVCRKQASNRRGRNSDSREWFLARARLGGRGGVWLEKGRHAYCEWCGARRCSRLLRLPKPPRPGVHEKGLVPWRKGLCIQALISGLIKPSAIGFLWMFVREGARCTLRGMGLRVGGTCDRSGRPYVSVSNARCATSSKLCMCMSEHAVVVMLSFAGAPTDFVP